MSDYDIVFISETHCNGSLLPIVSGFQKIFDPNFPLTASQGGQAAYIHRKLFTVLDIVRYTKCTLSLSFTTLCSYSFMSVYINPVNSNYYSLNDFGLIAEELSHWKEKGFTVFMGGDFNARLGDLNELSSKSLKWRYKPNVDSVINSHGTQLGDLCELFKILPLNHCKYYNKCMDGKFTFFRAGAQSQIDFCITSSEGRKCVQSFNIIDSGWHLSDHLPLSLQLLLPNDINIHSLLLRSHELGESSSLRSLKTFRFEFNYDNASTQLQHEVPVIMNSLHDCSPSLFLCTLEKVLNPILTGNKIKRNLNSLSVDVDLELKSYKDCDTLFYNYLDAIKAGSPDRLERYALYQTARNELNKIIFLSHEKKYGYILNSNDDRSLWKSIDWSGKRKMNNNKIPIHTMADHFEKLYQPLNTNENKEFNELDTDTYMPITDDPITSNEVKDAYKKMKKGGYDYSIDAMKMLMQVISPAIFIPLNLLFYVAYPVKLATSLLFPIPKKGNSNLVSNLRGIQMQPLLGILYDRIIANRLILWSKVSPEQTAFQKGKSTIDQIFLLRTVINLSFLVKVPLYIGYFDLAKAFDKVSRPLLLKTLIKLGVGAALFYAIKATYKITRCILVSGKKLSELFLTFSGIKQGAPSSVILFILFMDKFVSIVKEKCLPENMLGELHMLLHADDTVIFSTSRKKFIKKCNVLLTAFHENRLELNLSKSSFMIINPNDHNLNDLRTNIKLESGWLSYKKSVVYLGVIISDTGKISDDLDAHVADRSKSVFVKLSNFIKNNNFAPVTIKLKILKSCLESSLLYGCETWGSSSLVKVETLYRKAIKIVLSMSNRTPTELVYVESGLIELKCLVYKRQYKFWKKVLSELERGEESTIDILYNQAISKNLQYLRHYQKLIQKFSNADECFQHYLEAFQKRTTDTISEKTTIERNSVLNDYVRINASLTSPDFYHKYIIKEYDRLIITKYRSGSHFLKIQTGRSENIEQIQRLCSCDDEVQTLEHVLFRCEILNGLRPNDIGFSLKDFFESPNAAPFLRVVEKTLKLR